MQKLSEKLNSESTEAKLEHYKLSNEGVRIEPALWVKQLTGMSEIELLSRIKSATSLEVDLKWLEKAGHFSTLNISELRKNYSSLTHEQTARFTIYIRDRKSNQEYFDTSALQSSLRSSKPVMFQVASNFNCLENSSTETSLFDGRYLTKLMSDRTQGPSAAGGAGAGSIIRLNHHRHSPINLLNQTKCEITNGKITKLDNDLDADSVCVGLQSSVQANFNRADGCLFFEQGRVIDQVFASTLCIQTRQDQIKHRQPIISLLQAAYDGTYLAANKQNTERLVLTLVGGASFNNPLEEIAKALVHAHLKYAGNLEEVILPLFDPRIDPMIFTESLIKAGYPKRLITIEAK